MPLVPRVLALLISIAALFVPVGSAAEESAPSSQVAWRLLDYLAVDYAGAVRDGRVVSASE